VVPGHDWSIYPNVLSREIWRMWIGAVARSDRRERKSAVFASVLDRGACVRVCVWITRVLCVERVVGDGANGDANGGCFVLSSKADDAVRLVEDDGPVAVGLALENIRRREPSASVTDAFDACDESPTVPGVDADVAGANVETGAGGRAGEDDGPALDDVVVAAHHGASWMRALRVRCVTCPHRFHDFNVARAEGVVERGVGVGDPARVGFASRAKNVPHARGFSVVFARNRRCQGEFVLSRRCRVRVR